MTYIILRDTFGDGLETIPDIGVDVIEDNQLDEYIYAAADTIGFEGGGVSVSMGETLVICEILGELRGVDVNTYVENVLKRRENRQKEDEYQLYLKLKRKFEK